MTFKNTTIWGMRNLDKANHWQRLKLENYSPDKPVVVCIGGNGTTSENYSNGICKFVENHLQLLFKEKGMNKVYNHADIISAVYPINDSSNKGKFSKEDTEYFVDNFSYDKEERDKRLKNNQEPETKEFKEIIESLS